MSRNQPVLANEDFAYIDKLTQEQMNLATDFLDTLYSGSLSDFWDKLADIDRSRIDGIYKANLHYDENATFQDVLLSIREEIRDFFAPVRNDAGFSTSARYTHNGEIFIYVLENVKTQIVAMKEIEAKVFPVVLAPNVTVKNEEFSLEYKVSVYGVDYRKIEL